MYSKAADANVTAIDTSSSFSSSKTATIKFSTFTTSGTGFECKYFSDQWKTTGVTYKATGICETTHFTDFAIMKVAAVVP